MNKKQIKQEIMEVLSEKKYFVKTQYDKLGSGSYYLAGALTYFIAIPIVWVKSNLIETNTSLEQIGVVAVSILFIFAFYFSCIAIFKLCKRKRYISIW